MLTGVLIVGSIVIYLLVGASIVGYYLKWEGFHAEKPTDNPFPIPPWKLCLYFWPLIIVFAALALGFVLILLGLSYVVLGVEKVYSPLKYYVKLIRKIADMPEKHYDENLFYKH